LTAAISEMARERATRLITLGGLPADAVGEFIGATANIDPHDRLVAAVWRETSGNPLFVGEAVRLLSAEGRLLDVGDLTSLRVAVPTGVRAVIARRIGHLGKETARALVLGAAIGPEFSIDVLRRIGIEEADIFVSATRGDNRNVMAAQIAKHIFGVPVVAARVFDPLREEMYRNLGLRTINPTRVQAKRLKRMVEAQTEEEADQIVAQFAAEENA